MADESLNGMDFTNFFTGMGSDDSGVLFPESNASDTEMDFTNLFQGMGSDESDIDYGSLFPGMGSNGAGTGSLPGSNGNDTGIDFSDLFNGSGLEKRTEPLSIPLNVFRLLICVAGIVGNLLVITVILILKEYKKTVTHWYVLQLATADTLFLLCIPFRVAEDINDAWEFAPWLCKAKETILFLNYYSSVLFLIVMSVDRYIAVCHGFSDKIQKLRTPTSAMIIAGVVWGVSLLLCIPVMLYSGLSGNYPNCKCQYEFPIPFNPEEICLREKYVIDTPRFNNCVRLQVEHRDFDSCAATSIDEDENIAEEFEEIAGSGSLTDLFQYLAGSLNHDSLIAKDNSNNGEAPASRTPSFEDGLNPGCHYYEQGEGFKAFIYFNFTVMFLLPILVMTVCYTMIIMKLDRIKSRTDSSSGPHSNSGSVTATSSGRRNTTRSTISTRSNKRSHRRVNIMCAALVILFLVCWIPYHSVHLAKFNGIKGSSHFCGILFKVASLFAYINSAINPYLYNFIGTRFGKRMRSAASTVRQSVKRKTSSVSGTVRYHHKKRLTEGVSSSHGATVMTKIYKGKTDLQSTDGLSSNVFSDDSKHHEENYRLYRNQEEKNEDVQQGNVTPPPSYDNLKDQEGKNFLG